MAVDSITTNMLCTMMVVITMMYVFVRIFIYFKCINVSSTTIHSFESRSSNVWALNQGIQFIFIFYNLLTFYRISEYALRRPIRNTTIFKKPYRGRFGGLRRSNNWHGGARSGRGQMMMKSNNWNGKRLKKTVEELDRELDVIN